MRMDLMRTMYDEQRRQEMRKKSVQPIEGKPHGALKAWREVVTSHPDEASGRYQLYDFALIGLFIEGGVGLWSVRGAGAMNSVLGP